MQFGRGTHKRNHRSAMANRRGHVLFQEGQVSKPLVASLGTRPSWKMIVQLTPVHI